MVHFRKINSCGFSLTELLVVIAVIGILSTMLVLSFRSSERDSVARHQAASVLVANIRKVQSLALAGVNLNGVLVCGFGAHFVDANSYILYAQKPDINDQCASINRNYQAGADTIFETKTLANSNLKLSWSPAAGSKDDVYFEIPNPTTYINNTTDYTRIATIGIASSGAICPSANCTQITVRTSGKIDISN